MASYPAQNICLEKQDIYESVKYVKLKIKKKTIPGHPTICSDGQKGQKIRRNQPGNIELSEVWFVEAGTGSWREETPGVVLPCRTRFQEVFSVILLLISTFIILNMWNCQTYRRFFGGIS